MIRLLIFIAVLFAFALGAAWVADRPGLVTLDWQGYRIEIGLMTALVALAVLVALCIAVWNLILLVLRSPDLVGRFMRRRRRDRGYDALSRALLALGIGDAATATRYGGEAGKLLGGEPAAALVLAQSAQLAGRYDEARARFEAMLADPKLKPVGLHGLYVEAERLGEPVAARHYAEEAARLVPGLAWAGRAVLAYQAVAGDWADAIKSLERNYAAKLVDKKTFRRHKAVLLTAQALDAEDRDPETARTLAGEAHGLAPDLVPAAVLAARLASRRGDVRKAMKVAETTWKLAPHPDVADAYAHARTGDSAQDRLKRVKTLAALRAHNVEGAVALARAALEAGDFRLARDQLKAALTLRPTRRVFLMMADLEEAEHGDRGRVREWLARAVRAPADPAWVADGTVSEHWSPVSPLDGRLDAYVWTLPQGGEGSGLAIEAIDDSLLDALPATTGPQGGGLVLVADTVAAAPEVAAPDAPAQAAPRATETAPDPAGQPSPQPAAQPAPQPSAAAPAAAPAAPPAAAEAAPIPAPAPTAPAPAAAAVSANAETAGVPAAPAPSPEPAAAPAQAPKAARPAADLSRPIEFPLKHMPDDPGPGAAEEDEAPPKKPAGYRFFN